MEQNNNTTKERGGKHLNYEEMHLSTKTGHRNESFRLVKS